MKTRGKHALNDIGNEQLTILFYEWNVYQI